MIWTWEEFKKLSSKDTNGCFEFDDGVKRWFKNGTFHREDGPAVECVNGTKAWFNNGDLHRENGPAVEYANGNKAWFKEGNIHRLDGPAIELSNGNKFWYIESEEYTEIEFNKKISEMNKSEEKFWTYSEFSNLSYEEKNGKFIFADGAKRWYKDGKCHRLDGPAKEFADGYKVWYIEGEEYTEAGFNKKISEMNKSKEKIWTYSEFSKLSDKEKTGKFVFEDGDKRWFKEGKHHRLDGPALEFADGEKRWFKDGELHRLDGPAFEYSNGTKFWYKDGELHRLDGPAKEFADGYKVWYIEGEEYTEAEFNKKILKHNNFKSWSFTDIKGEKKMNKDNGFMDMVKSDLENAAYRVAATQMNKAVKAGIIKILESKGLEGPKAAAAAEMLDTEIGSAMVALLLGYGLKYAPKISEDTRAIKLSEEFRVKGMETVGNEVVGSLMEHLLPEVMNVLASLPETKADEKVRVIDKKETVDEEPVEKAKLSVVKGK